ncbi:alpha/beta fold hydrolase [Amycolatopsis sp. cmx-11-12]|uniref:alpha/beta fold hydrolase n=1 Tax=Amycolatopsis sp. cmx-11-12 TaxID=2785795 RepID=UPI00391812CE
MDTLWVNGLRLAYDITGTGPVVVLVSGAHPAAVWHRRAVPLLVDAGYQVVTFDHRGIPPSDVPEPPYSIDDLAADTIGVLEGLDLRRCHIVGACAGAVAAQRAALSRPELLRSVSFLAGGGNIAAVGRQMLDALVELYSMPSPAPAIERTLFGNLLIPPTDWPEPEHGFARVERLVTSYRSPVGLLGHVSAVRQWADEEHRDELARLTVPALAVAAEWDPLFQSQDVRAAMDAVPDGRYAELPGAPHMFLPQIDVVLEKFVIGFLREHDEPADVA